MTVSAAPSVALHGALWSMSTILSPRKSVRWCLRVSPLSAAFSDSSLLCPVSPGSEHPWPTYLEDAYGAALWLRKNADQLGVDIDRVAVAGDSAGGNISSILAQISAHQHGSKAGPAASGKGTASGVNSLPRFCFQVLLYPLLQWTVRFGSYRFSNASLDDSSKRAIVQAEDWFWAGFRSLRSVCLVPIDNGQHELASTRARDTRCAPLLCSKETLAHCCDAWV